MKVKFFSLFALLFSFVIEPAFSSVKYVSIATGGITGVYYPAGGAICRLVNRSRKENGMRCSVESTAGSVANLKAVNNSTVDFGLAQSDWHYYAYNGGQYFKKPLSNLRSVFSLHKESFIVAVREDSGINSIDDIAGKIVNFGPKNSGTYATMELLSSIKGWTRKSFKKITNIDPTEQPVALCKKNIDVMLYISGNPNGVVQEATQYQPSNCKIKLISIDSNTITKLLNQNPFYVKSIIPGGMYRNNPKDIITFGIKATLVTSKKVDPEIVYQVTKAFFENFENFKTLHPVFTSLSKKNKIIEANFAPLHSGALRYYREAELLN